MASSGAVIWFTGLSGAGKTTVSREIARALVASGYAVESLDGDEVRENLSRGLGFSKEDRDTNVRRIGFVARLLARNGVVVLVSAISPYRDARAEVRRAVEGDGVPFAEVFVRCPLEVLVGRDVKGLYARALAGEIGHFTGISDPYEEPLAPDVVLDSSVEAVEESAARVLTRLVETGVVDRAEEIVALLLPAREATATRSPHDAARVGPEAEVRTGPLPFYGGDAGPGGSCQAD